MTARHIRRKSRPKTISSQGLTGQKGINAIERIVLEMGSRWTPSGPNEMGIDGYIELFDANSGLPLGLTLAVQSKVVSALAGESDKTFAYSCDANDLAYWLSGNTPVILVVSSGAANDAYWISVKERFKDWKPDQPTRVTFDKAEDQFSSRSFSRLAGIAAPKSGLYLAPLRSVERLRSNLLPLELWPPSISIAGTDHRTTREVWAALREAGGGADAGWLLWEKKLFSFHDLSKPPWSAICDQGMLEEFSTSEWAESNDAQRQRIYTQLLNQTLKAQLSPEVRFWPQEECYALQGKPHKQSYRSIQRTSKITVISQYSSTSKDGRKFERFRHLAFRGQFRLFDDQWCLEITPTYRFTSDGFNLDRFHEENLKGIKRLEGNRAVLSSVLFWAHYLKPRTDMFHGDPPPLQFGDLLSFNCEVGIDDAEWLAADPGLAQATTHVTQKYLLPDFEDGVDL
jgi:hypothetical protein